MLLEVEVMKKLFSILLILSLLSTLTVPVVAADKNSNITQDIRDLLEENYNGVETETQFRWFVVTFTVFKDKAGVINICAYEGDYDRYFGRIKNSDAPMDEKSVAIANIKKHMENIAKAVMKQYPGQKFSGWYESSYIGGGGEEVVFYLDTWTNVKDNKATKDIIWQPKLDSAWILK
jgi:hypothetical protein